VDNIENVNAVLREAANRLVFSENERLKIAIDEAIVLANDADIVFSKKDSGYEAVVEKRPGPGIPLYMAWLKTPDNGKKMRYKKSVKSMGDAKKLALAALKFMVTWEGNLPNGFVMENLDEGTWAIPDTTAKMKKLGGLLKKKLPVGDIADDGSEWAKGSAGDLLGPIWGDDSLFDALGNLYDAKGPKADAVPVIRKYLSALKRYLEKKKVKPEVIAVLDSFSEDMDDLDEARPSDADWKTAKKVAVDPASKAVYWNVGGIVWLVGGPGSNAQVNQGSLKEFLAAMKAGKYAARIKMVKKESTEYLDEGKNQAAEIGDFVMKKSTVTPADLVKKFGIEIHHAQQIVQAAVSAFGTGGKGINWYVKQIAKILKSKALKGKERDKAWYPESLDETKQKMVNAQKPEAVRYMESLGWSETEISRMLLGSGYSAEEAAKMMGKTVEPAAEPVMEESREPVPFQEMLKAELTESVSEAENRLRDIFQGKQYKGIIPDADIKTMLKSQAWIKVAGSEKNLQKAWKNMIDDDFIEKKGKNWVWTLGYTEAAKEEDEYSGADHLRRLGFRESDISGLLMEAGASKAESSSFQDVASKHQIKIAIKTLNMNKVGASVLGGPSHKEAVEILRKKARWSDKKIRAALEKAGHNATDIKDFMGEDLAGQEAKRLAIAPIKLGVIDRQESTILGDGLAELEDMGIGGSEITSLLENVGHHREAVNQLTETLDLTEELLWKKPGNWDEVIHGKNCRIRWNNGHVANKMWIEELPGKPVKRKVQYSLIQMPPWMSGSQSALVSPFILGNLLRDAKLSKSMDYNKAVDAMRGAIAKALDGVLKKPGGQEFIGKMKPENVVDSFFDGDTVSYLQLEPDDYSDMVAKAKDFSMDVTWNEFKAYSPGSDLQSHDPSYTLLASKSPTAARKLYKIVKADPKVLEKLSWDQVTKFLDKNKIGWDLHFSVWH